MSLWIETTCIHYQPLTGLKITYSHIWQIIQKSKQKNKITIQGIHWQRNLIEYSRIFSNLTTNICCLLSIKPGWNAHAAAMDVHGATKPGPILLEVGSHQWPRPLMMRICTHRAHHSTRTFRCVLFEFRCVVGIYVGISLVKFIILNSGKLVSDARNGVFIFLPFWTMKRRTMIGRTFWKPQHQFQKHGTLFALRSTCRILKPLGFTCTFFTNCFTDFHYVSLLFQFNCWFDKEHNDDVHNIVIYSHRTTGLGQPAKKHQSNFATEASWLAHADAASSFCSGCGTAEMARAILERDINSSDPPFHVSIPCIASWEAQLVFIIVNSLSILILR